MTKINVEHPEYTSRKAMWARYRDLYTGGEQMRANAAQYLEQRQKEPADVYGERLSRVFYENYVGSIIDWYAATLFRREPELMVTGPNEQGKQFFARFADDCDRKGTGLSDFLRARLIDTLIYGKALILVDFPRAAGRAASRAEEDAAGLSRAYLVDYTADSLINWGVDAHGTYEWVVLRSSYLRQGEDGKRVQETIWRRYTTERYEIWKQSAAEGIGTDDNAPIELVAQGRHALALQHRVPVFEMKVSDGLWLMNKAGLLQLEHFNKSNALSWALTMGLFATPVVYSDREWNQIIGESYYIQLGPDDRFGWTEPDGKVFQIAADNLNRLQEEIYRVCYLLTQSQNAQTSAAAQSGLSKLRDFAITQEVLRAYGDAVKDCAKKVLRAIEAAREDGLVVHMAGLDDFDIRDFSSDLEDAQRLLSLGIESPTLRKQVFKRLAFKYLCDVRQDLKDDIANEIDRSVPETAFPAQ